MDQPKPVSEAEAKTQAPNQTQGPNPKAAGEALTGDQNWATFVMGSQAQTQTEASGTPTGSGPKKSVHWSPELVSESHNISAGAASDSHQGSNPYVAPSPMLTSSFSFKGSISVILRVYMYLNPYMYAYEDYCVHGQIRWRL